MIFICFIIFILFSPVFFKKENDLYEKDISSYWWEAKTEKEKQEWVNQNKNKF